MSFLHRETKSCRSAFRQSCVQMSWGQNYSIAETEWEWGERWRSSYENAKRVSRLYVSTNLQATTARCSRTVRLVLGNHIHSSDMAPTSKIRVWWSISLNLFLLYHKCHNMTKMFVNYNALFILTGFSSKVSFVSCLLQIKSFTRKTYLYASSTSMRWASYLGCQHDATRSRSSDACSYRSISAARAQAAASGRWACRRTDGWTTDRYMDPSPHTLWAASKIKHYT